MNTRKVSKILLLSVLASSSAPAWAANVYAPTSPDNDSNVPPRNLTSLSPSTPELFTSFTGNQATLAALGFFVSNDPNTPAFGGIDTGSNGTAGFYAYGPYNSHYTLGLLEASGSTDSRAYLKLKNDTGASVSRILVSYDIEQWRDGARVNQIGLRYSPTYNGFSSYSDVVTTSTTSPLGNPATAAAVSPPVSQAVSALVTLPTALAANDKGYLRWGYSSPGSGSRDGFGPTNIKIVPLATGTPRTRSGTTGTNWFATNAWTSYTWAGSANNAVFTNTALSPVNLDASASVVDILFNDSFTISKSSGTPVLTTSGIINVAASEVGTIAVDLDSVYGIYKLGAGELVLSAVSSSDVGGVNVLEGTLTLGIDNAINPANKLSVNNGTFKTNGYDVTVEALVASESSSNIVNLGSSGGSVLTVDMDVTSTASFRGLIIGTDATAKILKKGNGTLRFRSSPKTYSAITQVDEGVLEVTQNAELTNTADVIVRGETSLDADPDQHGTLYITNDSGSNESFTFGSSVVIDVKGGEIEFETTDDEELTLTNGIAFDSTDITGANEAHNNIKAEDDTIVRLTGVLSGAGGLRKTGSGDLIISNASNTLASVEVRNGSLELASGASIGGASAGQGRLYIKDEANTRTFVFHDNLTVAWLEASAPAAPAANTGFLDIPSTKTLTVNQTAVLDTNDEDGDLDTAEELKPSYDIALSGSGNFVKDGNGTLKFTNNAKTLVGSVTVAKGVLQVSKNGVISDTGVTVNSGGQLRLSTGVDDLADIADATYTFGGNIVLNSTQRDVSGVITSSGFGHLGGLRFDPDNGIQYAVLTNNIVINSASDIHVNGTEKILFLTGAISGSANLNRTGGGTVVIEGDSSYSGALTLTNGTTSIDFSNAAHSLDASSVTVATGAELGAEAANVGKITGNISVSAGGHLSKGEVLDGLGAVIGYLPVGPLKGAGNLAVAATSGANVTAIGVDVTATPVTIDGTVALPDDLVIDLNNAGTFGFYTLIDGGSGSATLNGGSTPVSITAASGKLLNAPSGVTEVELTVSGADIIVELK